MIYKYSLYGYRCRSVYQLFRLFVQRQICSLKGHPNATFHASTGVEPLSDKMNANIGVTFYCPDCYKVWAGDVKAGLSGRNK